MAIVKKIFLRISSYWKIGPGGLRVSTVVADESKAGHCFHSFCFLFFLLLFTHFGDTQEGEIIFGLIFWHNKKGYKKIIFDSFKKKKN